MVTHSIECARHAHRILHMRDGVLVREERVRECPSPVSETAAALAAIC
jgi:energy-coupling factor transporter ATP-binding protein EcfA2